MNNDNDTVTRLQQRHPRIALIGPMGAGKTSIGRRLGDALGLTFVDSDHEIEQRTGVDIGTIFDIEGEEGFRRREEAVIDALSQQPDQVLATGGGAILSPLTRQRLRERTTVIYLDASVEQQFQRTRHDRNRPLLQHPNPKQRLQALFQVRAPLYEATAHFRFTTDGGSPSRMVKRILDALSSNDDIHSDTTA